MHPYIVAPPEPPEPSVREGVTAAVSASGDFAADGPTPPTEEIPGASEKISQAAEEMLSAATAAVQAGNDNQLSSETIRKKREVWDGGAAG